MQIKKGFLAVMMVVLFMASAAFAGTKKYQVTGPIVEVDATKFVVKKGKDNWTLHRDASTKLEGGEPAVGDKVTIEYSMTATNVEVKKKK